MSLSTGTFTCMPKESPQVFYAQFLNIQRAEIHSSALPSVVTIASNDIYTSALSCR